MDNTAKAQDQSMILDIEKLRKLEEDKKEMLRELLSEKLRDEGHILVRKSHMGSSDSYIGTASFRWIDKNVRLFTELQLFKYKVDTKTGNLEIDEEIIDELQQRAPKWSRQPILTYYLTRHRNRKFPPILVVIMENWVNDPKAPEWDEERRAKKSSVPLEFLDHKGEVALIDCRHGVTIYVIDGSHRLLGIKGLMEILGTGNFIIKNAIGTRVSTKTRLELAKEFGIPDLELDGMEDEQMGIEFIPAVMEGETREEARIRIRSIFVHVNKTAQPPTYGEQVILDEDDGFSIIARKVALEHRLLRHDRSGDRINWKSSALPDASKWLTTATTLRDMAEIYLCGKEPFNSWAVKRREIPVRPSDSQIEQGTKEFTKFLDHLAQLPSFADILRGGTIADLRVIPDPATSKQGRGHLLMRPLGQLILAEAVGYLHNDENGPKIELDLIIKKLKNYDASGGFENVHLASSPWYGITYDPQRKTMLMQGRNTAVNLLRYLINALDTTERETLLKEFRNLRTIKKVDGTEIALNYDGHQVKDSSKIQLPPMI